MIEAICFKHLTANSADAFLFIPFTFFGEPLLFSCLFFSDPFLFLSRGDPLCFAFLLCLLYASGLAYIACGLSVSYRHPASLDDLAAGLASDVCISVGPGISSDILEPRNALCDDCRHGRFVVPAVSSFHVSTAFRGIALEITARQAVKADRFSIGRSILAVINLISDHRAVW